MLCMLSSDIIRNNRNTTSPFMIFMNLSNIVQSVFDVEYYSYCFSKWEEGGKG